ncbi:MAG: membrane protein insertase YidC [Saprospiraceae bacterium]|nr:membrane protein insertase YidC [Saprospiraceae bacterium]
MDRTQGIGLVLIFVLAYFFMVYNSPSEEEIEAQKRARDSIEALKSEEQSKSAIRDTSSIVEIPDTGSVDSLTMPVEENFYTLQNDLIEIKFSNKGGQIREVTLANHKIINEDEDHDQTKAPLKMMNNPDNRMGYVIKGLPGGRLTTADVIFSADQAGNTLTFTHENNGVKFEKSYTLLDDSYLLDVNIKSPGILNKAAGDQIELEWVNYLNKLELNEQYERYYSTVYFKESEEHPDYCSCRGDDQEKIDDAPVEWIAHSNQFFNTSIVPESPFTEARLETVMLEEDDESLKLLKSRASWPLEKLEGSGLNMKMYIGPNDFKRLAAFDNDLEDIIPFGSSIFGTINRWVIRPVFNYLSRFILSAGIVIIALTVLVKLALYPLTYKMLHSQMKMAALKPEMQKLKAKFKDDQSKQQMETMKMYREYGVNPLGGCMPMILQMPIWFALYRFFPASIEFRQASFLWASDLSSYDVIAYLPFNIPMFGAHISLFTLLWAGTTLLYTWYNSRLVDMSANPAMKYMQYFMPVMFLFFFNNYASGLTCYLMFSNITNIGQTMLTKNFIIDEEKIKAQLNKNKSKPKKKGGFQQRLEKALKEQQKIQAERQKKKKK